MSQEKKGWRYGLVRQHLQNAVYLELWTIPLYLTAAYSIKITPGNLRPRFAPVPVKQDGSPDYDHFTQENYNQHAFNNLLSVAIQEMLHVELAANLLNAIRPEADLWPFEPWVKFTRRWAPKFTALPPCLEADLPDGVTLGLGPLDVNRARLLEWIEQKNPNPPPDPEAYAPTYPSIGDFYAALRYGLKVCWTEFYPPRGLGPNPTPAELLQKEDWARAVKKRLAAQKGSGFLAYFLSGSSMKMEEALKLAAKYPFSIKIFGWPVEAWVRADAALAAIRVQGEGAGPQADVPTEFVPTQGNPIEIALDKISHWGRFRELRRLVEAGKIQVYNEKPDPCLVNSQRILNQSYSSFLSSLDRAFASTKGFSLTAMEKAGDMTFTVWKQGGLPEYKWLDTQSASGLHACQGLNACAGQGVNGSGTKPGDGDCATAIDHFCGGQNDCAGEGGCGSPSPDVPESSPDQWSPNFNSCAHTGGCATPIRIDQKFGDYVKKYKPELENTSVWAYARQLMRKKFLQIPAPDPEPSQIRKCLH
jgi:hypothetical protein